MCIGTLPNSRDAAHHLIVELNSISTVNKTILLTFRIVNYSRSDGKLFTISSCIERIFWRADPVRHRSCKRHGT
jgi:hypothetical protein